MFRLIIILTILNIQQNTDCVSIFLVSIFLTVTHSLGVLEHGPRVFEAFSGAKRAGAMVGLMKSFCCAVPPSVVWELGAPSIVPVTSKGALSLHTDPQRIPSTRLPWVGGWPPPVSCLIDSGNTQSHLPWTLGAFLFLSVHLSPSLSLSRFWSLSRSLSFFSIEALTLNERTGHCEARDRPRGGA